MEELAHLSIQLLGSFVLVAGASHVRIDQSRLQRLLVYLLLHRHHPRPRQQIAFTLWADTNEEQALKNLRTLLTRLRQSLPDLDLYLETSTYALQWRPDVPCHLDVASFEAACGAAVDARERGQAGAAIAAFERAAALYTGDLTPGWYDEWLVPERERLRDLHQDALHQLVHLLAQTDRRREALGYAQQLLRTDPLREVAYRLLMQLHLDLDDRASALRVFHTCATTLRNELGVDPSPATQALYLRSLGSDDEPVAPQPAPAVELASDATLGATALVGRQAEWETLRRAWQSAASGRAQMILISGEAGIGKTRLAEELLAWVARQGAAITAVARCYASGGSLAYAPVAEWLRSSGLQHSVQQLEGIWRSEVARLLPELLSNHPDLPAPGPMTEAWQRQRFFQALNRGILGAATESSDGARPLLLLLDDAQWCDRETLDWLHYLLQANAPLLVLATVRVEEVDEEHPLNALRLALARHDIVQELYLAPLNAAATSVLAADLLGHNLAVAEAARLFHDTEGNPLFVVETVRAGMTEAEQKPVGEGLAQAGAPAAASTAAPPPKVRAVILRRLALLSPDSQTLVQTAAVLGREFTFPVLVRASGQDEAAVVQGLDELWRHRILREQGADAYDFSHDKIRVIAYADLSPMRRRAAHRRADEAIIAVHHGALEAVSIQVARHYEHADQLHLAISYYCQAANAAQRVYAYAEVLGLLNHAGTLLSTLAGDSGRVQTAAQLHEQIGDAHSRLAQHGSAVEAYRAAMQHVPANAIFDHARLHRKIGGAMDGAHRSYDEVSAEYETALSLLDTTRPGADKAWWGEWCQIQLEYLLLLYWWGDTDAMDARLAVARPLIERYGTPTQRATLLGRLSNQLNRANRYVPTADALELARAALDALRAGVVPGGCPDLVFAYGFNLLWHRQYVNAEAQFSAALEIAIQEADVSLQARCLAYLALLYRLQQCPDQVMDFAQSGLEVAHTANQQDYVGASQANLAWVAWQENDTAETERLAHAALDIWHSTTHRYPFYWQAVLPLLSIALERGEIDQALDFAKTIIDPSQQRLPDPIEPLLHQAINTAKNDHASAARSLLTDALSAARTFALL